MTIGEVLARHTDSLMAIPGVVGVGEGRLDDRPAVQVLISQDSPAIRRNLPTQLGGFPVQVVVSGVIRAQPDS